MATLTIKDKEVTLKFSIALDKVLNKTIKDDEETAAKRGREKLSGGITKALPELIEEDVEILAEVFLAQVSLLPEFKGEKITIDDVLEAIDERIEADDDAEKIFKDVFEAIDQSAFSRRQLVKFADNMKLVKELRSEEFDQAQAELMVKRINEGYHRLTGKVLIEVTETKA